MPCWCVEKMQVWRSVSHCKLGSEKSKRPCSTPEAHGNRDTVAADTVFSVQATGSHEAESFYSHSDDVVACCLIRELGSLSLADTFKTELEARREWL
jgi:hypothetical protein